MALDLHTESQYMTVEKTDGSSISFYLEDNPVISYQRNLCGKQGIKKPNNAGVYMLSVVK